MSLRPYQISAVNKVRVAFESGVKSALVVLPTGLGKTICMSAIAEEEVKKGGRVLFLAHRNKLLDQGAKEIEGFTGIRSGFEMGKHKDGGEPILVSSVQTLSKEERLKKYTPDEFSLIMVDEAHHVASSTYQKILSHFTGAKLLGVTATPVRGDHTDISGFFEEVASEYTLSGAIRDGWLSPIVVQSCPVEIDVSEVELQSGDYSASEVGEALKPYLEEIARQIREKAAGRKVLVFVPLVATAKGLVEIFHRLGVRADYVAGERKDSEAVMERYHNGDFNVIVNSMLLTEGYNEPAVDAIVNLRLTRSETLATQIIGRGTRKAPGKENLLILDFLWRDKGKRNKVGVASIIAGDSRYASEEERQSVLKACENLPAGEQKDVFLVVEDAVKDVRKEREEALARAIREAAKKQRRQEQYEKSLEQHRKALQEALSGGEAAGRCKKVGDSLSILFGDNGWIEAAFVEDAILKEMGIDAYMPDDEDWKQEEASEAQLHMLKQLGIPVGFVSCKGHAGQLIDVFMRRRTEGYCSYKQAKALYQRGVKNAHTVTAKQASAAMAELSRNHWRTTKHFYEIVRNSGKELIS